MENSKTLSARDIYAVPAIRVLEDTVMAQHRIDGFELMSWAAEMVFEKLQTLWPQAKKIIVLCGGGNNAGDGYLVATKAQTAGIAVEVVYLKSPEDLPPDAKRAAMMAKERGVKCSVWQSQNLRNAEVLIDALLGIGYQGALTQEYQQIIAQANQSKLPILAVDVPSGLNAQTGGVTEIAIHATATVTFFALKPGVVTGDAFDCVGELFIAKWPHVISELPKKMASLIEWPECQLMLPHRRNNSHKFNYGHLLIIGGAPSFGGAVRMAAESALRAGAGVVSIATHPSHANFLTIMRPEIMYHGIEHPKELEKLLETVDFVVIGPGIGQSNWAKELWHVTLASHQPMLVDADALRLLAQQKSCRANWILTPHPGEAAELLNVTPTIIQQHRYTAIHKLIDAYGGQVVLKGAGTLVGNSHELAVNAIANPSMASPGMGDALAGIIGALVAQGMSLFDAAKVGVAMHTAAAARVCQEEGNRGLLVGDLWRVLRLL